jgi:uncharacterized protein GlcG (DUF336 family)
MHVSYEQAEIAIAAAIAESKKLGTQMCIAVVDSGADLKAFTRMNGAWVGSIDIAIKKAKTAVFFGMNTGQIGQLSQPGGPLFGIEHSNQGLITFPGYGSCCCHWPIRFTVSSLADLAGLWFTIFSFYPHRRK